MLSLAFESILKKYCDSFRFSPLFSVYFFGKGSDSATYACSKRNQYKAVGIVTVYGIFA